MTIEEDVMEQAMAISFTRNGDPMEALQSMFSTVHRDTLLAGIEMAVDEFQAMADMPMAPAQGADLLRQIIWLEKPLSDKEADDRHARAFPKPRIVK